MSNNPKETEYFDSDEEREALRRQQNQEEPPAANNVIGTMNYSDEEGDTESQQTHESDYSEYSQDPEEEVTGHLETPAMTSPASSLGKSPRQNDDKQSRSPKNQTLSPSSAAHAKSPKQQLSPSSVSSSTYYQNPYELNHSNSLVSVDWRNESGSSSRRKKRRSPSAAKKSPPTRKSSTSAVASSLRKASSTAPHLNHHNQTKLRLIHDHEQIVYFTESLIPDTSSDSIFIDSIARILTLKSPFTIHSQIWVTTHRIVVRRFHARDGDGVVETEDEEDVAEHRTEELLSRVSSIGIRKESAPRNILNTPMRGYSQKSAVQRLLGQIGVGLQSIIMYGPVLMSFLCNLLIFLWLVIDVTDGSHGWKAATCTTLSLLVIQKLVSIISGVILSIGWYRWWKHQNQVHLLKKQVAEKRQRENALQQNLSGRINSFQHTSNTPSANTPNPNEKASSLPVPIQKKKIVLFTLLGVISLLITIVALILCALGELSTLVIAFILQMVVTVVHIFNLFVFIPTYRHSYPAIVKIYYGDISSSSEDYFSLAASDEQKNRFVMYQLLGCVAGCGWGLLFTCISYLKQKPSNYKSLKELPQTKNHNQVLFLQYDEAVKLRDVITSLKDARAYPENVDASIVYADTTAQQNQRNLLGNRPPMQRSSFTSSSVTLKGGHFSLTRQHVDAPPPIVVDSEPSSKEKNSLFKQSRRLSDVSQSDLRAEEESDEEELRASPAITTSPPSREEFTSSPTLQRAPQSQDSVLSQEYELESNNEPADTALNAPAVEENASADDNLGSDSEDDAGSWDLSEG